MSNKKQKITHCTENLIVPQTVTFAHTFTHTFTLCDCTVCTVPHNPTKPVCAFEDARRKLAICSSKITNPNCKRSFKNFFQNSTTANTEFVKNVCEKFSDKTCNCFTETPNCYEFIVSAFDESKFIDIIFNNGLVCLPLWIRKLLSNHSNTNENISENQSSLNTISRIDVNAINCFIELLGAVMFMKASSSSMMNLTNIFEKAKSYHKKCPQEMADEIKNYIRECDAHRLVSWNIETNANRDIATCVQFKYDFGNEYKMLLVHLNTFQFSIGDVIEKETGDDQYAFLRKDVNVSCIRV